MEDPCHPNYPQELMDTVGPRNMVHSLGDRHGRPDRAAALGQGRQAEDRGRRHALSEADGDRRRRDPATYALKFIDKAKADDKPFFLWLNPTRMHVVTHLSDKYEAMRNSENGWSHPGSRHGAARRHRRLGHEEAQGQWAWTTTPSSSSPPTTAPRTSPGRMADRRRLRGARAPSSKAASACRPSSAGRARCPRARSRTASSPGWTGSRPSSPPPAIRTSSTN